MSAIDHTGDLLGIICGNVKAYVGRDAFSRSAADVMTRSPQSIKPQALAAEAVALMNERKITNLS